MVQVGYINHIKLASQAKYVLSSTIHNNLKNLDHK